MFACNGTKIRDLLMRFCFVLRNFLTDSAIFCAFRYVCLIFWFESCSCWVALVLQKNTSTRDEKNTKFNLNQNCHRHQKDKWLHFNLPYHRPSTRLRQTLSEGEGESAYGSNILIGCWDNCIQTVYIHCALYFDGFCGSWSSGLFVVSLVPAQVFRLTSQKLINKNANTNAKFFQTCRDIKKKYQWMGSRFLAICLCRLCISSYFPECVARADPSLGIDYPPYSYHFLPSLHHHYHHYL